MDIRKVLVTGGAGFIGSHLVPKILARGMDVRVLDSLSPQVHGSIPNELCWLKDPGCEFVRGSVTSRTVLERALDGIDAIVHLAAETGTGQSMYEIAHYNQVNSQATALMFDVLGRDNGRHVQRVVLSSSRSVYGEGAYCCPACNGVRVFPGTRTAEALARCQWDLLCPSCLGHLEATATKETDAVSPASIYAATKHAQEDLVRIACQALGIGYVVCRLQNVYGEGQSLNNPYTGILSIFSTKVRLGKELPLFEDGLESRDFVHVDDATDALLRSLILERSPNTVVNVGSGVATTVRDVAKELALAFGARPNLTVTGQFRLGDIRHNYADITRLRDVLGIVPKIDLRSGLARFAHWVLQEQLPEDRLDLANDELRQRKLMS